jgi:ABC-2 type transport system permease protein
VLEGTLERATKVSAILANVRAGRGVFMAPHRLRADPFALAPIGPQATAILWKNLLSGKAWHSLTDFAWLAVSVVVMAAAAPLLCAQLSPDQRLAMVVPVPIVIGVAMIYAVLLTTQMVRSDFRQDLAHAEVMKTWPIKGWQLAIGEVLRPWLVCTAMIYSVILVGSSLLLSLHAAHLDAEKCWTWAFPTLVAAMLLPPCVAIIQVLLVNALALLFPKWLPPPSSTDSAQPKVFEAQGKMMFMGTFQVLALGLVGGLALAAGGVTFGVLWRLLGLSANIAAIGGTLITTLVALTEAAAGVLWLGRLWERHDPSEAS